MFGVLSVLQLHMGFYKKCTVFIEAYSWQTTQIEGFVEHSSTQEEADKPYLATRSILYEVQSKKSQTNFTW